MGYPVLFIHGYNAREGEGTVDRMRAWFQKAGKHFTYEYDYSFMNGPVSGLLGARLLNARRAREAFAHMSHVAKFDVVAHSNGCAIAKLLMEIEPYQVRRAVFINPALDRCASLPPGPLVYCLHTPGEMPTRVASWLPFHPWGRAGSDGMTDPNVLNVDTSNPAHREFRSRSHSDKFQGDGMLNYWSSYVYQLLAT